MLRDTKTLEVASLKQVAPLCALGREQIKVIGSVSLLPSQPPQITMEGNWQLRPLAQSQMPSVIDSTHLAVGSVVYSVALLLVGSVQHLLEPPSISRLESQNHNEERQTTTSQDESWKGFDEEVPNNQVGFEDHFGSVVTAIQQLEQASFSTLYKTYALCSLFTWMHCRMGKGTVSWGKKGYGDVLGKWLVDVVRGADSSRPLTTIPESVATLEKKYSQVYSGTEMAYRKLKSANATVPLTSLSKELYDTLHVWASNDPRDVLDRSRRRELSDHERRMLDFSLPLNEFSTRVKEHSGT
ncbi:hypothetical protein V5O48_019038, partial [Marasmius crinis-equi]